MITCFLAWFFGRCYLLSPQAGVHSWRFRNRSHHDVGALLMRRLSNSWSATLSALGFKRKKKARKAHSRFRHSVIESLEQRLVFSTSQAATPFPVGNCTDGCECECSAVSQTSDDSAVRTIVIGDMELSYNSSSQPHPTFAMNLYISAIPDPEMHVNAYLERDIVNCCG